jgi:hypothetical protein
LEGFFMTRSQIRKMVDELAEGVQTIVFQALDAEIWIQGEEAGQVAATIERAFRREIDTLFSLPTERVSWGETRNSHDSISVCCAILFVCSAFA